MDELEISKLLFEFFNANNVRYCHWKSNSHLDKALNGKTDLDILIHPEDRDVFERACKKFAIKKILSPPMKLFPGLEDFLGFDHETGSFIHLHIHYNLILGQKYIKNHHLPIKHIVFNNLIYKNNVAIPVPELELLLLIIRAHMKLDAVSLLKHGIRDLQRQFYCPFPRDIEGEISSLIKACDMEKFNKILAECNLPLSSTFFADFIDKFSHNKFHSYDALTARRQILSLFKKYRRQTGMSVYLKYFYLFFLHSRPVNFFIKPDKKTIAGTGKIFSLVGADGSGKSTLIQDLEKWLSWKISVKQYYYGIPKNNLINFADLAIRAARKFKLNFMATLTENFLWLFVARNRYKIFLLTQKGINHGNIVLTDRFPMKEFQSMKNPMDGPRLSQDTEKQSGFSLIENNYYEKISCPDCIFVLQVDIKELRKRKTDLGLSTHEDKAAAVNAIRDNQHIILIDANRSYRDVLLTVKRKIWNVI